MSKYLKKSVKKVVLTANRNQASTRIGKARKSKNLKTNKLSRGVLRRGVSRKLKPKYVGVGGGNIPKDLMALIMADIPNNRNIQLKLASYDPTQFYKISKDLIKQRETTSQKLYLNRSILADKNQQLARHKKESAILNNNQPILKGFIDSINSLLKNEGCIGMGTSRITDNKKCEQIFQQIEKTSLTYDLILNLTRKTDTITGNDTLESLKQKLANAVLLDTAITKKIADITVADEQTSTEILPLERNITELENLNTKLINANSIAAELFQAKSEQFINTNKKNAHRKLALLDLNVSSTGKNSFKALIRGIEQREREREREGKIGANGYNSTKNQTTLLTPIERERLNMLKDTASVGWFTGTAQDKLRKEHIKKKLALVKNLEAELKRIEEELNIYQGNAKIEFDKNNAISPEIDTISSLKMSNFSKFSDNKAQIDIIMKQLEKLQTLLSPKKAEFDSLKDKLFSEIDVIESADADKIIHSRFESQMVGLTSKLDTLLGEVKTNIAVLEEKKRLYNLAETTITSNNDEAFKTQAQAAVATTINALNTQQQEIGTSPLNNVSRILGLVEGLPKGGLTEQQKKTVAHIVNLCKARLKILDEQERSLRAQLSSAASANASTLTAAAVVPERAAAQGPPSQVPVAAGITGQGSPPSYSEAEAATPAAAPLNAASGATPPAAAALAAAIAKPAEQRTGSPVAGQQNLAAITGQGSPNREGNAAAAEGASDSQASRLAAIEDKITALYKLATPPGYNVMGTDNFSQTIREINLKNNLQDVDKVAIPSTIEISENQTQNEAITLFKLAKKNQLRTILALKAERKKILDEIETQTKQVRAKEERIRHRNARLNEIESSLQNDISVSEVERIQSELTNLKTEAKVDSNLNKKTNNDPNVLSDNNVMRIITLIKSYKDKHTELVLAERDAQRLLEEKKKLRATILEGLIEKSNKGSTTIFRSAAVAALKVIYDIENFMGPSTELLKINIKIYNSSIPGLLDEERNLVLYMYNEKMNKLIAKEEKERERLKKIADASGSAARLEQNIAQKIANNRSIGGIIDNIQIEPQTIEGLNKQFAQLDILSNRLGDNYIAEGQKKTIAQLKAEITSKIGDLQTKLGQVNQKTETEEAAMFEALPPNLKTKVSNFKTITTKDDLIKAFMATFLADDSNLPITEQDIKTITMFRFKREAELNAEEQQKSKAQKQLNNNLKRTTARQEFESNVQDLNKQIKPLEELRIDELTEFQEIKIYADQITELLNSPLLLKIIEKGPAIKITYENEPKIIEIKKKLLKLQSQLIEQSQKIITNSQAAKKQAQALKNERQRELELKKERNLAEAAAARNLSLQAQRPLTARGTARGTAPPLPPKLSATTAIKAAEAAEAATKDVNAAVVEMDYLSPDTNFNTQEITNVNILQAAIKTAEAATIAAQGAASTARNDGEDAAAAAAEAAAEAALNAIKEAKEKLTLKEVKPSSPAAPAPEPAAPEQRESKKSPAAAPEPNAAPPAASRRTRTSQVAPQTPAPVNPAPVNPAPEPNAAPATPPAAAEAAAAEAEATRLEAEAAAEAAAAEAEAAAAEAEATRLEAEAAAEAAAAEAAAAAAAAEENLINSATHTYVIPKGQSTEAAQNARATAGLKKRKAYQAATEAEAARAAATAARAAATAARAAVPPPAAGGGSRAPMRKQKKITKKRTNRKNSKRSNNRKVNKRITKKISKRH